MVVVDILIISLCYISRHFDNAELQKIFLPAVRIIHPLLLVYTLIFIIILLYRERKKIINSEIKKILKVFSYGIPVLLPGLLAIDIFYGAFRINPKPHSAGLIVYPAVYLIWNILFLVLSVKFFLFQKYTNVEAKTEAVFTIIGLTGREKEISLLIFNGLKNKEIAEKLFISEETVKKHIQNIYSKVDARNRVEFINTVRNKEKNL